MRRRLRTVGVERVMLGALTGPRRPLDPELHGDAPIDAPVLTVRDVANLLGQDGQPSPTVDRLINRALRSHMTIGADRSWREPSDAGHAAAIVEIGPGLGWDDGTLFDPRHSIPDTMATAAVGRPVGVLIQHPDIDSFRIMHEPRSRHGLVSIDPEIVQLPVPRGPLAALRRARLILAWRRTEKRVPVLMQISATSSVVLFGIASHLAFSVVATIPHAGAWFWTMTVWAWASLTAAQTMTLVALDLLTGRLIGDLATRSASPYETTAHDRQAIMLITEHKRRGFGFHGEPE